MKKTTESKFKRALMLLPDGVYKAICGNLDCTYCTFYRGVLLGLVLGTAVGVGLL